MTEVGIESFRITGLYIPNPINITMVTNIKLNG